MPSKSTLSVVSESTPRRRMSVVQAAKSGDRLNLLRALRDQIAADVTSGVPARDLAALSRRLMELSKEIEGLEGLDEDDVVTGAASTPDEAWQAQ